MARKQRDQSEGVRHVTCRGNRRQPIFVDDYDRERFLMLLAKVSKKFDWRVIAYCLMTNHIHLVVDVPAFTISRGMQILNGQFAQAFNRRHGYTGHLFQGRFHDVRVDSEAQLLAVAAYVVLNPTRAGMVHEAVEWRWSSHRAVLGKQQPPPFLDVRWTLGQFARRVELAREAYGDFIAARERALAQARREQRERRGQAPGPGGGGHVPYD